MVNDRCDQWSPPIPFQLSTRRENQFVSRTDGHSKKASGTAHQPARIFHQRCSGFPFPLPGPEDATRPWRRDARSQMRTQIKRHLFANDGRDTYQSRNIKLAVSPTQLAGRRCCCSHLKQSQ